MSALAGVALLLAGAAPSSPAQTPADVVGLSLSDALAQFEDDGLRIFYSSDLVRPGMRVATAPAATQPSDRVAEILDPHGLMLRRGLNDTWLVVRQPRRSPAGEPQESAPAARTQAAIVPSAPPLEELIVAASQYQIARDTQFSTQSVGKRDLEFMPDVGDDAIRAVARLPGIASNGFSALSHFRGGEPDETLVRLDGLRLYDPFHLRDFQAVFSAIDPRIVSSMNIYTGGFPAVYGDRMSGVVDVETMPVAKGIEHEIGVSFFHTSVLSSGNFADSRAEWIASVRRSNLAALYSNFSDLPDRPRYSDVFAKLRYAVSDDLAITGYVLRAEDEIQLADDEDREENATASQRDAYTWLRLELSPGPLTSGTTLLARTSIAGRRIGTSAKPGVSTGRLSDDRAFTLTTLQSDWSRLLGSRMLLDFGATLIRQSGRYDYSDDVEFDLLFDTPGAATTTNRTRVLSLRPRGRQHALYSTLRFDWNQRFASEFGLRWNRQVFDGIGQTTRGPRLGVRYELSDQTTLRASWGRFHQSEAINELQISDGITQFHPPQRNEQFVVGFDRLLPGGTMFRFEAYEKRMDRLRPRFENLLNARVVLPELKPDRIAIAPLAATARGVELAADGTNERIDWWASLSWARVEDRFADTTTLRSWDQTTAFNGGLHWDTGKWDFSAAVVYRTGWPTTTVALDDSAISPTVSVPVRNDTRLRAFGSLDLRLARRFEWDSSTLSLFGELTNVTDRSNPCCLEYEIGDEEDAGLFVLDERSYLPSVPSLGFLWTF